MKIAVRGTNWIGDAVMTIPALRELRRLFPEARIFLHTPDWAEGIFQDADFVDEIMAFPKSSTSLKRIRYQAKRWREERFDLAVLFTNSFQSALLSKLGGAAKRFGYRNEGRSFLLTNAIKKPEWKDEKHEVFYYLNLVSEIEGHYFSKRTVENSSPDISLPVSKTRRAEARSILSNVEISDRDITIALGVGSTNSRAKRWPAGNYSKLNDLIQSELGAKVLLIGSGDELHVSELTAKESEFEPIILTGKTSLSEAVSVLSEVRLLVSNDMGLAHVSAAVGTKTLTIFGPTNPAATKPWGSEILVRKDVDCAPCMLRDCPIDHRCMTRISPESVFEKVKELISKQI